MHAERYRVPDADDGRRASAAERVVAIGTTSVRALESAAATGELEGRTELFIHGDRPFALVGALLTNFHQPRSSLLVLVDAFVGPAVARRSTTRRCAPGYRFLSFGDAMFLAGRARMTLSMEVTATRRARRAPARSARPAARSRTPCFMPVGTKGAVRHLSSADLADLGVQIVLGNTYHLMLKPGADVIGAPRRAARLRRLVRPRPHRLRRLPDLLARARRQRRASTTTASPSAPPTTAARTASRPESAVDIQTPLGSDIQMVLDVCAPLPSPTRGRCGRPSTAPPRGRRGPARAFLAQERPDLNQFGIVQGGTDLALRAESAERTLAVGFDGYAIGGLSVGESRDAMLDTLAATLPLLPDDQPRYLMGLGDPLGMVEAVALGIDLFDCVLPDPLRPPRHDPLRRRSLQPQAGREHRRRRPARRGLRLPGVRPLVPGLPAPPPGGRRAHGAPAHHPPQPLVDPRPRGRGPGRRARPAPSTGCVRGSPRRMANLLRRPSRPSRAGSGPTSCAARSSPPSSSSSSPRPSPWAPCLVTDTSPQLGLDLQGGVAVVLEPTEDASDEALDQTIEIIRNRVDALGVAEPEIARQGDVDRRAAPRRRQAAASPRPGGRHRRAAVPARAASDPRRPRRRSTTADDSTTTTAADGDDDHRRPPAGRRPRRAGRGADAPPPRRSRTTTTHDRRRHRRPRRPRTGRPPPRSPGEPTPAFELTPREEDLPEATVVLAELDDDGEPTAAYQLGPSQATGEIVADADAELDPTGQWSVSLEMKGGADGIDQFNAIAAQCNPPSETCPTGPARHRPRLRRAVGARRSSSRASTQDEIQITRQLHASPRPRTWRWCSATAACRSILEPQTVQTVSPTLGEDSLRAGLAAGLLGLALVVPLHDLLLPGPRHRRGARARACGRRCSTRSSPSARAWR